MTHTFIKLITMRSNLFIWISCECILLFCIVVAYSLDADNNQVLVEYRHRLALNKQVEALKWNDAVYTTKNIAVSLPLDLVYKSGIITKKLLNNPPSVKIIAPENDSFFDWNALMNYTIKVSDVEDGDSDSLEIASNEVFLEVVYLPNASMSVNYIGEKTKSNFESPGFLLLRRSDCFSCHNVKTGLQGPAFISIAKRYPHNSATVKMLARRVIEGSSGVWGISAMSSHPDLTEEQAGQIIQWILENAENPNRSYYSGTKGTFQTRAKLESENSGVYLLTAGYTDQGVNGMSQVSKTAMHTIVLRSK